MNVIYELQIFILFFSLSIYLSPVSERDMNVEEKFH
jgi:hypothetical protein